MILQWGRLWFRLYNSTVRSAGRGRVLTSEAEVKIAPVGQWGGKTEMNDGAGKEIKNHKAIHKSTRIRGSADFRACIFPLYLIESRSLKCDTWKETKSGVDLHLSRHVTCARLRSTTAKTCWWVSPYNISRRVEKTSGGDPKVANAIFSLTFEA